MTHSSPDELANLAIAENAAKLEQEEYDRLRAGEPPSDGRRTLWRRFLAWKRLSPLVVCQLSFGRGLFDDYHDYPDTESGTPFAFGSDFCVRCGKPFSM